MNKTQKNKLILKYESLHKWNMKLFNIQAKKDITLDYDTELNLIEASINDTKKLYNKLK